MDFNEATTSRPAPIGGVGPLGLGDTTPMTYRCFTNMSLDHGRGYQPGDPLVAGWTDTIAADTLDVHQLAEQLFTRHNSDDRPDGQLAPSLSVGDVVIIAETALTVERVGFAVCSIDAADVVTDMTYRQYLTNGPVQR